MTQITAITLAKLYSLRAKATEMLLECHMIYSEKGLTKGEYHQLAQAIIALKDQITTNISAKELAAGIQEKKS